MTEKLIGEAREAALKAFQAGGWSLVEGRDAVTKTLKFRNFSEAWGAMSRIALKAEAMDHHPEWFNVYATLTITLSTHDAGGLSEKDVTLAAAVDRICG